MLLCDTRIHKDHSALSSTKTSLVVVSLVASQEYMYIIENLRKCIRASKSHIEKINKNLINPRIRYRIIQNRLAKVLLSISEMLRGSLQFQEVEQASLLPRDKHSCAWISDSIIIQCVLVFIGAATIGFCVWTPEYSKYDYDKLSRIMYLYDPSACGYNLRSLKSINSLQLKNDTKGLGIFPVEWKPPIMTVSTKLSAKTRKYVNLSVFIHVLWMLVAISLRISRFSKRLHLLKFVLATTFYVSIFVVIFDLSMAIVYIAHIQKSLTNGMILRYSGWGVELKLNRYDDFGGWLPIVASICWMRGVIILCLNIYCCRMLQLIRRRIKRSERKNKLVLTENYPIPEPKYEEPVDDKVLYYRAGEHTPVAKKTYKPYFFYF